ncbi:PH domain-containing protein [Halalkalibacterium ligniniphilum]|uniref:PH domain-containing protein n=1 Tax=Halalkalibacterium ligniniphilum TaxID=1134413 RepID=UPI00034DA011|nr:PH domain-containing protein [Halalkalibacterium ligniniphilum]
MNKLKRLHPAAIVVSFLSGLRGLIVPLLISLFLGSSNSSGFINFNYIFFGILTLTFFGGLLHWLTFRYCLFAGELYVEKGLLIKKKRYIRKQRIQAVDVTAGIFQRMFSLVKVKIETAGGGNEPEVQLIAITRQEAESLRKELLEKEKETENYSEDDSATETEPVEKKKTIWKLDGRHLLLAAMTSSGIGLTLSAVAALYSQIEQFIPDAIYEKTFGFLLATGAWFIVGLVFFLAIVAWLLSMIGTLLKYGGFTLEKNGDELIISRGLLEKRQLTLNAKRVTAIRFVSNVLRQPFGFTSVYVESAGGGSNDEQLSTILIPLIHMRDVEQVIGETLPEYSFQRTVQPIPKRALPRTFLRLVFIPIVITVLLFIFTSYGSYSVILVFFALLLGYFQYRDAGSGYNDDFLWIRYRKLNQVMVVAPRKKIQNAETGTSYFQKRLRLTSFFISVQSSIVGKTFVLKDMDEETGMELLSWFSNDKKH